MERNDERRERADPNLDEHLEADLTGGGAVPPDLLGADVAEFDPEAGTPAALELAAIDLGELGPGAPAP
jgi:hypothetical protein